jgi:hypothetical protein
LYYNTTTAEYDPLSVLKKLLYGSPNSKRRGKIYALDEEYYITTHRYRKYAFYFVHLERIAESLRITSDDLQQYIYACGVVDAKVDIDILSREWVVCCNQHDKDILS